MNEMLIEYGFPSSHSLYFSAFCLHHVKCLFLEPYLVLRVCFDDFFIIWINPITTYAFLIVVKYQLSPHINHKHAIFLLLADYISLDALDIDISKHIKMTTLQIKICS
jgi:hypothetical protein